MEIGFRVFFLEEDGSLRNIPWQTYVGLYHGFPSVRFPEYSGKTVKCVHVVVELEDRAPVSILESIFFVTHFNPDGGMDQEKRVERQRVLDKPEDREEHAPPRPENDAARGPSVFRRQERGTTRVSSGPAPAGKEQCVIDLLPRLSGKRHDKADQWVLTEKETEDLERRVQEYLDI